MLKKLLYDYTNIPKFVYQIIKKTYRTVHSFFWVVNFMSEQMKTCSTISVYLAAMVLEIGVK